MTDLEKATAVVAKLEAKRAVHIQKGTELQDEQANVSLAAHTGDAKARKRLDEINTALALHASELQSLDAALRAAGERVAAAQRAEAEAAAVANVQAIKQVVAELAEHASVADDVTKSELDGLVNLLCEATPGVTRRTAAAWLMHTPTGRSLITHTKRLAKARATNKQKETTMPETFSKMVADVGIHKVAKAIVDRGHSSAVSEEEFSKAVTEYAKRAHPALRPAAAFEKVFCDQSEAGETLRRAHAVLRDSGFVGATYARNVAPVRPVGKQAAAAAGSAYEALMAKARALAEAEGTTVAQAFSKIFVSPENRALAEAERNQNRPRA
jgi:hypothetical protein